MGGPARVNGILYPQFDNFYPCRFMYDGRVWCSSEQLYQASKFKDEDYRKKINIQRDPSVIWNMGQSREHNLIDGFEERKYELMYTANFEKFAQNKDLRDLLISTGDYPIECKGSTDIWNRYNSEILTQIRERLRQQF